MYWLFSNELIAIVLLVFSDSDATALYQFNFLFQFNSLFLRYRIHILHNYIHIHNIGHERTCT